MLGRRVLGAVAGRTWRGGVGLSALCPVPLAYGSPVLLPQLQVSLPRVALP